MANIPINVRDGFLVHWCDDFMGHFGEESEFVRAVSDLYTIKVSRMMERSGSSISKHELGLFSTEDAVDSIRSLINKSEYAGKILYKEAFGTATIGSTKVCIDSEHGGGTFDRWLNCFEKNEFDECLKVIEC
jgi:hypothetical protein